MDNRPGATDDRLFLSARSRFTAGAAIRGGMPVCFPQFATQGPLPSHGFARVTAWDLVRAGADDDGGACAILRLVDSNATRRLWPYAFMLELAVHLSRSSLDVALTVVNTGSTEFSFTDRLRLPRSIAWKIFARRAAGSLSWPKTQSPKSGHAPS